MNLQDCTLLLTRPDAASARFHRSVAAALGEFGRTIVSPLIRIALRDIDPSVIAASAELAFTSENGVAAAARYPELLGRRAWCVGRRTAGRAAAAGFAAKTADGNVDALFGLLSTSALNGPVVHLSGAHSSGNLAGRLNDSGVRAERLVVYDQLSNPLSAEARMELRKNTDIVAPVFSPRSSRLLLAATGTCKARLHVVAISDAAASPWDLHGTANLVVAAAPDSDSMLSAMGRLFDAYRSA